MNPASISKLDLVLAAPEIFMLAAVCVVLLIDLFVPDERRWLTLGLALATLAGTAWTVLLTGPESRTVAWHGTYVADPVGRVLKLAACAAVAVAFVYSYDYLKRRGINKGEYFVLGLFALLGIMVLVSANSLITIYLGVELLGLSMYAMVAFNRDSGKAVEAAIKYFVLGSIASGALLFGMSMIYGLTGSLEIGPVSEAVVQLGGTGQVGLLFGLAFLIVGVAFKFGAVPFHMWVPDVYQGAPTPVTLFLSSAPKLGSFALAYRLLAEGLGGLQPDWQDMLAVLAVLSMAIGNVLAIAQTDIKRMLAYSTISHVGFILLGILSGTAQGYQSALYYTLAYVIMSIGGFGVIILLSRKGFEADQLDDFKGLSARSPWFAGIMLMLMFSMAGVPPFVGFWAKLAVIQSAIDVGQVWLAIVAVLFSVIGAYYYLRVIKLMYFDVPLDKERLEAGGVFKLLLSLNGIAVLVLGLFPGLLLALCVEVLS